MNKASDAEEALRVPATEAGRNMAGMFSDDPAMIDYILAIEQEARRSTVISPECYPQAHRYRAVPGSRDLVRCYRCGKERYA